MSHTVIATNVTLLGYGIEIDFTPTETLVARNLISLADGVAHGLLAFVPQTIAANTPGRVVIGGRIAITAASGLTAPIPGQPVKIGSGVAQIGTPTHGVCLAVRNGRAEIALNQPTTGRQFPLAPTVTIIGDSITLGHLAGAPWSTNSYVSLLKSRLQGVFGSRGEGFLSTLHDNGTSGTGGHPNGGRWTYGAGWDINYAATRQSAGMLGGFGKVNTTATAQITVSNATRFGVVYPLNHNAASPMRVKIDGVAASGSPINLPGDNNASNFRYGQVTWFNLPDTGSHTILLERDSGTGYIWFEGIIVENGSTGLRLDQVAKGWVQAEWLGNLNESTPGGADYFDALRSIYTALDADLYVVALSINDYVNQVATATFETRLTTIANQLKAHGEVILCSCPQPDSALTIPYSQYVAKISAVATATNCTFADIHGSAPFSGAFQSGLMADLNHPNTAGHDAMADILEPIISNAIYALP